MESEEKDPTKPWYARPANGFGRADWVVVGQCPERHDDSPEDGEGCSAMCPACYCGHCDGEGTHLIADKLTEAQANQAVAQGSLDGIRSGFGATIGDLIKSKLAAHAQPV